ncbi:MAG: GntR family transcriptional regulator [Thermomicrobiales bacterium]|nr:GntR family transcriptional regulator [Thermomicrobiales bacterium]MCO5223112.1 GntR family transcriptional regulator [Thermomicrobiales bacterium]
MTTAKFSVLSRHRVPRYRELALISIKGAILDGTVEPGEPLFEERLASSLGISRTPVREALAILEHEGLISPTGGRGLGIREITREEFLELCTANEVVEPYLARSAATRATEDGLFQLEQAIEIGRRAVVTQSIHESLRSGREFHRVLGEIAGCPSLAEFVVRNEEKVDLYLISRGDPKLLGIASMEQSNDEHSEILNAIRARDPDAAHRLVIYHAQSLRHRLEHLFQSVDPPHSTFGR